MTHSREGNPGDFIEDLVTSADESVTQDVHVGLCHHCGTGVPADVSSVQLLLTFTVCL